MLKVKVRIKKSENEVNNANPYAGLSNSHRRNVVKASFCLSARSARVKEAQVESCEYTKTKWVGVLCSFYAKAAPSGGR